MYVLPYNFKMALLCSQYIVPSVMVPSHGVELIRIAPHIGHLHTLVLTDTFARFARLRNPRREVLFNTGTDEHGMKIQQAAKVAGVGEREFCDGVSERFRVSPPSTLSRPPSGIWTACWGWYLTHGVDPEIFD